MSYPANRMDEVLTYTKYARAHTYHYQMRLSSSFTIIQIINTISTTHTHMCAHAHTVWRKTEFTKKNTEVIPVNRCLIQRYGRAKIPTHDTRFSHKTIESYRHRHVASTLTPHPGECSSALKYTTLYSMWDTLRSPENGERTIYKEMPSSCLLSIQFLWSLDNDSPPKTNLHCQWSFAPECETRWRGVKNWVLMLARGRTRFGSITGKQTWVVAG